MGDYSFSTLQEALRSGPDESLRKRMIVGTAGTFFVRAGGLGLGAIASFVLARLLGAEGYGAYAYAVSWVMLLGMVSVLGLNTLSIREVASARAREDWSSLSGLLRWSRRLVTALSIGLTLLAAIVLWLAGNRLSPDMETALWVALPAVPLFALLQLFEGSVKGLGRVVQAQVPLLTIKGLVVVLALILVPLLGRRGFVGTASYVAAAAIALGLAIVLLRRRISAAVPQLSPVTHGRAWLRSAVPFAFLAGGSMFNTQINVLMLGSLAGAEAAGLFDIARKVVVLVPFAFVAVNAPLGPAIAELHAKGEHSRLQRLVTKSTRIALLGSLLIGGGLLFFRHWLLALAGEAFQGASVALVILCVGQVVNVAMGSVGWLLNMTGHERETAKGLVLSILVNIGLNAALIPGWGINGAAVAAAVASVVWSVVLVFQVRRCLAIDSTSLGWVPAGDRSR